MLYATEIEKMARAHQQQQQHRQQACRPAKAIQKRYSNRFTLSISRCNYISIQAHVLLVSFTKLSVNSHNSWNAEERESELSRPEIRIAISFLASQCQVFMLAKSISFWFEWVLCVQFRIFVKPKCYLVYT